jgi:hypothetical protein
MKSLMDIQRYRGLNDADAIAIAEASINSKKIENL